MNGALNTEGDFCVCDPVLDFCSLALLNPLGASAMTVQCAVDYSDALWALICSFSLDVYM